MTAPNWTLHTLAAVALVAGATRAEAQPARSTAPPVVVFPQINTLPGLPAAGSYRPAFGPGLYYTDPAPSYPAPARTRVRPANPFARQPINNPLFAPKPLFVNNPFALAPPNDPFANPFLPAGGSIGDGGGPAGTVQPAGGYPTPDRDPFLNPLSAAVARPGATAFFTPYIR